MMTENRFNRAVFLTDDSRKEYKYRISSGWDYKCGSVPHNPEYKGMTLFSDGNNQTEKAFVRDINPVNNCKVGLVTILELESGESFFVKLYGKNDIVWTLCAKEGVFFMQDTKTHASVTASEVCIYTETDLEKGSTLLYIDDIFCGEYKSGKGLLTGFAIGFDSNISGVLTVKETVCFANFPVCDRCFCHTGDETIDKWNPDTEGCFKKSKYFGDNDAFTYILKAKNNMTSVSRAFEKLCGKVCFEMKYYTTGKDETTVISLTSEGQKKVSVVDESTDIISFGKRVRKRHANVWQTVRIEADTRSKTALIRINGKKCGEFGFVGDCDCFDGIKIEYLGKEQLLFTDVLVYILPDEPEDYVPEPVLPPKKDYTVGMNICSLWRNGNHVGWDEISPYDDIQTYLGTYDEGIPEVADWETKWLAEHGVDFGLYCWYNNEVNAPLFGTPLSFALEDGYFNSKYSDKIKFAILWEALNCARADEEGFRNHVVPYWMDHYFSDDRYMTIDNKVVISVFGPGCLIKDFGSPEGVKCQLDYVREKVKELGYDGAIFIACAGADEKIRDCGFDAVHAYSHGHYGYDAEHTKKVILSQIEKDIIHVIPTISVGFNEVAWAGKRYPTLNCEDMRELLNWVKEDVLPDVKSDGWKKKTVMLSTWNEYGEGTYMMPSSLCGFGYLDEVRRGFTESFEHTDIVPTEEQLKRLGYIFPRGHALLKNMKLEKNRTYGSKRVISLELNPEAWNYTDGFELTYTDGILKGKSTVFDPQMIYKSDFPVDAASVRQIRLRMRADRNGSSDYVYFHFLTDGKNGGKWDMEKSFEAEAKSDRIREYVFDADSNKLWSGNITAFRFDPLGAEGEFEVEAIELVCDESRPVINIDGKQYKTSVAAVISDDGVYVPFDHETAYNFGIYCKWNRLSCKLYLEYAGKTLELEKGSDNVSVCGKIQKLAKPLEFFDGLPMINLDLICSVFGSSYSVNGKYINIKK